MTEATGAVYLEMTNVYKNSEWNLESPILLKIVEEDGIQRVIMDLWLTRHSHYYMILLAFPTSLLMIMNVMAFFIPVDNGEKLSFTVTIFLAQTWTFAELTDMLPASSENFPILGGFMVNGIGFMCSTCVCSVLGN